MTTTLLDLGFNLAIENHIKSKDLGDFEIGRIIRESKKKYVVKTSHRSFHSRISGKLRHHAQSRADYPAVGDWVALSVQDDDAIIHHILPRQTIIERQAIGRFGKKQTIATNVDVAFIMQDITYDFNLNRLDRLVAIAFASNIQPVIILTKIDIAEDKELEQKTNDVSNRFTDVNIMKLSNKSLEGFQNIVSAIEYGKTYCFIGASGAGKSSLINNLLGEKVMLTKSLREKSNKGQHTTSHRELFILPNSGILIDTPGMRELGIAESQASLESTFEKIFEIANSCKFNDCSHTNEPKCAVKNAVKKGKIEQSFLDNFHKMKIELEAFELNKRGIKDKDQQKRLKSDIKQRKSQKKK